MSLQPRAARLQHQVFRRRVNNYLIARRSSYLPPSQQQQRFIRSNCSLDAASNQTLSVDDLTF